MLAELSTAKRASETELRRLSPKGHNAKKFHVSSVRVIFAYFIQRFLLAITYILQPLNLDQKIPPLCELLCLMQSIDSLEAEDTESH